MELLDAPQQPLNSTLGVRVFRIMIHFTLSFNRNWEMKFEAISKWNDEEIDVKFVKMDLSKNPQ